jgi:16S rRNA (cytosine967-C5)-methyltransferase
VLVDPPCSGLGTLRSRPDLRWRASPEQITALPGVQLTILRAGASRVRSGGTLVYSVGTITRAEGDGVVERFLADAPDFVLAPIQTQSANDPFLRVAPHREGTDGFFVARLQRR